MTHARTPCPLTPQAVGWALHSLEPDEEMAVLLHVPQCIECRAAVHDTEAVLADLGTAVGQVEPPAALRSSILSAAAEMPQIPRGIRREPPTTPVPTSRHQAPAERPAPAAPPRAPAEQVRPPARQQGRRTTRRRLLTMAAALLAVFAIGGLGVRTAQLQSERDTVAARAENLTTLVQQLGKPHALLAVPKGDGTAVAAVVLANGQREVYTVGLPANAADQTYVLWGLVGDKPSALGAFDVASADRGLRGVGAAAGDKYEAYAISIEPGRTPPTTPSKVVAAGALVAA